MHIKYKAISWDMIYGQDHIKKVVEDIDLGGRCLMLEGEPGTGKTQIAEIIASNFAKHRENIEYRNCADLGINDIRELMSNLSKSSFFEGGKVLILDEPQELNHKARQDLLTPLLNIPDSALVIACSAFPERMAKNEEGQMVLDRFLRLKTRKLNSELALKFLSNICKKENTKLPKWLKVLIIEYADGIPRKILTSLTTVKSAEDEEEARYLLELNRINDEDSDILEFMKILFSTKGWNLISDRLKVLLKSKTPEAIRVGLMNLIAGKMLSNYYNEGKDKNLYNYFNKLKSATEYPEKSVLIAVINEIYYMKKGE